MQLKFKGVAVYETSAQGVLGLEQRLPHRFWGWKFKSAIQSTFKVINDATVKGANLEKVLKLTGLTQKNYLISLIKMQQASFRNSWKVEQCKRWRRKFVGSIRRFRNNRERAFTVVGSLAANYSVLENAMNLANVEYVNNIALNKVEQLHKYCINHWWYKRWIWSLFFGNKWCE
jgi:hypothetical protein